MKREYEGNEWGDAKRQRGTGPYVDVRILLPSKVQFELNIILLFLLLNLLCCLQCFDTVAWVTGIIPGL